MASEPLSWFVVPASLDGARLDAVLAAVVPGVSRSRLQKLARRGLVWIDGREARRSNVPVRAGTPVQVRLEDELGDPTRPAVVHEDETLLVVRKPAGLLTHAIERSDEASLAQELARSHGPLSTARGEDRPGIVHRLDRDTSGLLVLARTDAAMEHLRDQFRARTVEKSYLAVVHGRPARDAGTVDAVLAPDARHPDRQRVVPAAEGRAARTHWRVEEELGPATLVRCELETGRRHQIRVHLTSLGHPIVGDRMYERREVEPLPAGVLVPKRQALHAARLGFAHPATGERRLFEDPLPPALAVLVDGLRRAARGA